MLCRKVKIKLGVAPLHSIQFRKAHLFLDGLDKEGIHLKNIYCVPDINDKR